MNTATSFYSLRPFR